MMKKLALILLLASPAIAQEPDRSWMLTELRSCFENADSTDGRRANPRHNRLYLG